MESSVLTSIPPKCAVQLDDGVLRTYQVQTSSIEIGRSLGDVVLTVQIGGVSQLFILQPDQARAVARQIEDAADRAAIWQQPERTS